VSRPSNNPAPPQQPRGDGLSHPLPQLRVILFRDPASRPSGIASPYPARQVPMNLPAGIEPGHDGGELRDSVGFCRSAVVGQALRRVDSHPRSARPRPHALAAPRATLNSCPRCAPLVVLCRVERAGRAAAPCPRPPPPPGGVFLPRRRKRKKEKKRARGRIPRSSPPRKFFRMHARCPAQSGATRPPRGMRQPIRPCPITATSRAAPPVGFAASRNHSSASRRRRSSRGRACRAFVAICDVEDLVCLSRPHEAPPV